MEVVLAKQVLRVAAVAVAVVILLAVAVLVLAAVAEFLCTENKKRRNLWKNKVTL
jgi:hypothetical protein